MLVTDRPLVVPHRITPLLVLLAIAGPSVFVMLSERIAGASPSIAVSIAVQIFYGAFAAALIGAALRIEHASVTSLGLSWPTWRTVVLGAGILLVAGVILPIFTTPLMNRFNDADVQEGVRRLSLLPMWFRLVMAVTGGAIEETLYRGYATSRLVSLTGRPWVAVVIAALGFGLAHIPEWGSAFALAVDLPFGIFMTVVFLWRRDLLANILAHSTGLVIAMLRL